MNAIRRISQCLWLGLAAAIIVSVGSLILLGVEISWRYLNCELNTLMYILVVLPVVTMVVAGIWAVKWILQHQLWLQGPNQEQPLPFLIKLRETRKKAPRYFNIGITALVVASVAILAVLLKLTHSVVL